MSHLIRSYWSPARSNPSFHEAISWATRHKAGAAIGAGGVAAFLFMRPAQDQPVIVVNPTGPVTTAPEPNIRRALGVGAAIAAVVGVALYAAGDE